MAEHHNSNIRILIAVLVLLIAGNVLYTLNLNRLTRQLANQGRDGNPHVALVVGSEAPYWEQCIAGAQDAARKYNVDLDVHIPTNGLAGQNEILRELLSDHVGSIAISPVAPGKQASLLNLVGGSANLITIDSDAPRSRRRFYLGTNNYKAGRQCGQLIKEALPDGGTVVITCGSLNKVNGQERRMGLIDELLDRAHDPSRESDLVDAPLVGETYTVLETVSDGSNRAEAARLAKATLEKYPNVDCIAGLYAYNIPKVLEALAEMPDRKSPVLVSFDDRPETLDGIEAGAVFATLAQVPYTFGFEAVRLLAAIAEGPESGPIKDASYFSCTVIKQDNLDSYRSGKNSGEKL